MFLAIICSDATASSPAALHPICSFPVRAIDWTWVMCTARSMPCRGKSGCATHLRATDRVCTTSGTALPCRHCCTGTAAGKRLRRVCPSCRLTSGMFVSVIPTGISAPTQNYWDRLLIVSNGTGRAHHEADPRFCHIAAALLYRTPYAAAAGEPAHDQLLPRHFPSTAPVHPEAAAQDRFPRRVRRYRRPVDQ